MLDSYTLTLSKAGMDAVLAGLSELPYKAAKPVLDEALRQFIAQEAAAGVPQPGASQDAANAAADAGATNGD